MKKQTFLPFLATVAMMCTGTAQAQTKYDLYIAGTQVTSDNCNDLSKIKGVTGKAKYDNATKTLTLDNATISNTADEDYNGSGIGIDNKTDDLTIYLIGNNTVTSEKSVGVWNADGKALTFTNDGTLKVSGSTTSNDAYYQSGIFNYGTITVNNCT
ncbi:MAG: 50S ribosomal protein L7/L12, partial [Prevotella aurantiaca]|nr:50S ribosomal protein L7/L12 [Prevotella aurantiaca]